MLRVKIVKDSKKYKKGDTVQVTKNEAFGLLDSGQAVISKDMVSQDYTQKKAKKRKQ